MRSRDARATSRRCCRTATSRTSWSSSTRWSALAPGIAGPETLLYGVEVKFYSSRLEVDAEMRTPVAGLWAIGDGAGVTRGLVQSSASGVVAARSVVRALAGAAG